MAGRQPGVAQLTCQAYAYGCGKFVIRKARKTTAAWPGGMPAHTICSTLFWRSNLRDVPMFPCRSSPFAARTIRSRSFWSSGPGGSLHTSVILNVTTLGDLYLDRFLLPLIQWTALAQTGTGI